MCEHQVSTKVENGMIITYCAKCGAILDSKMVNTPNNITCNCGCHESAGGLSSNGGQILHG